MKKTGQYEEIVFFYFGSFDIFSKKKLSKKNEKLVLGSPNLGVSLSSSDPGARSFSSCWFDADNFFLFGGYGFLDNEGGRFSDIWNLQNVLTSTSAGISLNNSSVGK